MNRPELLAPAGSMEALVAAVSAGSDAVYLGGIRFGARAYASNFNEESLCDAVSYCHLRNVKVYVTVNTLVYENELDDLRSYLKFLYDANVDAVIVQDFGVFHILRTEFPDFEVHCSTQMHIHNKSGVQLMKKMGASRVVLARETPVELIRECTKEGIEIEVFVHGALCVCYSGQCLFSSFHGGRSGNRGQCAQPCRKPYDLINISTNQKIKTKGNFLLSPKDLWTVDHVDELIEAGISSFKIEGRMKRPEYVAEIVRVYRKAIDDYFEHGHAQVSEEDKASILKLFNRQMTEGHLFKKTGYDLMNPVRPNHLGVPLGKVTKVSKGRIQIQLVHDLHQNDGVRILSSNEDMGLLAGKIVQRGRFVNAAYAGDVIELETSLTITCRKDDQVVLTTDRLQCEEIERRMKIDRQFPVSMFFHAEVDQCAQLVMSDGINTVSITSEETVQRAQKVPVSEEKIRTQLSKLNDTVYVLDHFEKTGDEDIFISLKTVNQMRRDAVDALNQKRLEFKRVMIDAPELSFPSIARVSGPLYEISELSQYDAFQNTDCVFSSKIVDYVHVKGHRVDEHSTVLNGDMVMHTQIGSLLQKKNHQIWIGDASLNVTNSYAIEFLMKLGLDAVVVSLEADDNAINAMCEGFVKRHGFMPQIGKMIYGRRELMVMKACLINAALGNGLKTNCSLCKSNRYGLISEKGNVYPISQDGHCHPVIYESEILKDTEFSDKICFSTIRFTDESSKECKELKKYYENIFRRI